jgi:threonine dehydratase
MKVEKKMMDECHRKIKDFIHETPVLHSRLINEIAGATLYFKCENFQKMGAFKIRGAANAILNLSEEERAKGVVTHSSGNFAQAVSLAAQSFGINAYIVMPENAPKVKKAGVNTYGGNIVECESTIAARESEAQKIVNNKGATFLHPSNQLDVIIGQGTACKELLEKEPELDFVFAPVGGGGLVAGTALAANFYSNKCKVIGGEPEAVDDAYRSLKSGKIESNQTTNTIADGLRTQLGDINFPIIQQHVDRIIRVTEDEIVDAMRLIWERMKIVVEPSSAVALAAMLKEKVKFTGKKVGIILSGGNVDLSQLSSIFKNNQ